MVKNKMLPVHQGEILHNEFELAGHYIKNAKVDFDCGTGGLNN